MKVGIKNKDICRIIFVSSLALFFVFGFASHVEAATGDITAVRITNEGWYAEIDISGFTTGGVYNFGTGLSEDADVNTVDNNPSNAKIVFTVTSQGYNSSGVLGTVTRTVYGTRFIRKPYPFNTLASHNVPDESAAGGTLTLKVALSEFIYDDDKNGGAGTSGTDVIVNIASGYYTDSGSGGSGIGNNALTNFTATNSSTLHYPKVIGRWAWPAYERVTGDFLVEAVAFHKFAQNAKPVAAMVFAASDQSGHSVSSTITDMTVSTRSGDANPVLVYATTIPVSTLTQAQVIDVNFTAYPWIGDASSILDSRTTADGFAQPDERLGPLQELNDKSGTYGIGYAYVNSTTGNDTTGTVYSSQGAAEAGNKYLTIRGAASGLKTYHNANGVPTRNNAGGGIILLAEGNHDYDAGTQPNPDLGTSMDTWLIIKPASTAATANTIISSGGANMKAAKLKIQAITLSPSVTSGGGFTGRVTDAFWVHGNTLNATGTAPFFAWRAVYATQNIVTALTNGFQANIGSSSRGPFALVRGNNSTPIVAAHFYGVLGNKNVSGSAFMESGSFEVNTQGHSQGNNAIYAFNSIYNMTSQTMNVASVSTSTGIAVVQNLFESISSTGLPIMFFSAGGGNGDVTTNFIIWHNTFTGERVAMPYNSQGSTRVSKLNYGSKFNLFSWQGQKTDTFDSGSGNPVPNGIRTGNWPIAYSVGFLGNKSMHRDFEGDFQGLFSQWGPTSTYMNVGFISDKSFFTGTGAGNGDYNLLPTSTAIDTADTATTSSPLHQLLPYDLLGNPRYGGPDSGALEYQPPYTMGTNPVSTSATIRTYGNEKFRNKTTPGGGVSGALNIAIPGSDTTQWIDATISTWVNTGTRHKVWTETSGTTGVTNTVHVIGDLAASTNYVVSVDGVVGANITGASCTSGVCTSNGPGQITFTYTGTYSSHTFDVEEQSDATAPTIANISSNKPNGTYSVGEVIDIDVTFSEAVTSSGNVTVTLDTGRTCTFTVSGSTTGTCDYTVQAGDTSSDLTTSSISGTITDALSNAMINFTPATNLADNKAIVIDTTAPVRTSGSPTGTQAFGTASVSLTLDTDEDATCRYFTTADTGYGFMTAFTTTGATAHSETINGLSNGTSYTYYVKCQDTIGNTNATDYSIAFGIASDATSPTVSMTAPITLSTVSGASVNLSANASDNDTVAGVQFKLDTNTSIGVEDISSPYSVTWDSTAVSDGAHQLTAVARDNSGNLTTSETIEVTVDNSAPVLSMGQPSGSQAAGTTDATLSLYTNEDSTCKYSTNPGTTYGSMVGTFTTTGNTNHSSSITGLSDGQSYNYYVRCEDGSSNTNGSDYVISFSVATPIETTPPPVAPTPAPATVGVSSGGSSSGGFITLPIQPAYVPLPPPAYVPLPLIVHLPLPAIAYIPLPPPKYIPILVSPPIPFHTSSTVPAILTHASSSFAIQKLTYTQRFLINPWNKAVDYFEPFGDSLRYFLSYLENAFTGLFI